MAEWILAEGWQFAWFAVASLTTLVALWRGSIFAVLCVLVLFSGWFITNAAWQSTPIYAISDVLSLAIVLSLWRASGEAFLLTIAALYGGMLVTHAISPGYPAAMVALNAMYGGQLAAVLWAVTRGSGRRARTDGV